VEAMNILIKTIILNSSHVRKLNTFHKLHRSNLREATSEDAEESPVPTLGIFMNINQPSVRPLAWLSWAWMMLPRPQAKDLAQSTT